MNKLNKSVIAMGVTKAVASAINRASTTRNFIQQAAMLCVQNAEQHGNWTPAVEMIEGITKVKGTTVTKLVGFFELTLGAKYDKVDGVNKFVYPEGQFVKENASFDIACENNWFDFKAEPKDTSKTLDQIHDSIVKELNKSIDADKVTADDANLVNKAVADILATIKARNAMEILAADIAA